MYIYTCVVVIDFTDISNPWIEVITIEVFLSYLERRQKTYNK